MSKLFAVLFAFCLRFVHFIAGRLSGAQHKTCVFLHHSASVHFCVLFSHWSVLLVDLTVDDRVRRRMWDFVEGVEDSDSHEGERRTFAPDGRGVFRVSKVLGEGVLLPASL